MPQNLSQLESIPNNGEIPTYAELPAQNKELLAQNAALLEQVHQMREEMQSLRDEIARLKKQKPKPTIRPSKLTQKEKKQRKRRNAKKRGTPVR